jgi:mannose-6-phosphate isomerase-like protein (cupin superfamily)
VLHIRDDAREIEDWRSGVRTRMYVSAATGASQLVVFEQWCDPGHGAPLHIHAVEEVLRVLSGVARIEVEGESATIFPGESVIIPAGQPHGFTNTGTTTLRTQAILAAPTFEAEYLATGQTTRRWLPSDSAPHRVERSQTGP